MEIARRTGLARNTVRAAVRSEKPPSYERGPRPSKLDPFKKEIERLLRADHRLPGTRVRELLAELGYDGGKTILDDHLRGVRPRFTPRRTYQRTVYRPGKSAPSLSRQRPIPQRMSGACLAKISAPAPARE